MARGRPAPVLDGDPGRLLLAPVLAAPCRRLADGRSEEHTSELQSLRHLVCRLLLEKKKKKPRHTTARGGKANKSGVSDRATQHTTEEADDGQNQAITHSYTHRKDGADPSQELKTP